MSALLAAARIKPADLVTVDDLSDYCAAAVRLIFRGKRYGSLIKEEATETLYADVIRGITWRNVPMYPKTKRAARSSINGGEKVNYSKNNAQKGSRDTLALEVTVFAFPKSVLPPFGVLIGKARNLKKSADRAAAHVKDSGEDDTYQVAADEGNRAPRVSADEAAAIALDMLDGLGLGYCSPADAPLFTLAYSCARFPTLYALDVAQPGEQMADELGLTHDNYKQHMSRARKRIPSVAHKHEGDVSRGGARPAPAADGSGPLLIRPKAKHAPRAGRRGGLRAAYADALLLPEGGIARKASSSRTHSADLADSGWREDAAVAPVSSSYADATPAATRPHWTTGLTGAKAAQLSRAASEQGRTIAPAPAPIMPPEGEPIGGTLAAPLPTLPPVAKTRKLTSAVVAPKVDPVQHAPEVAKLIAQGKAKAAQHAAHTPRETRADRAMREAARAREAAWICTCGEAACGECG